MNDIIPQIIDYLDTKNNAKMCLVSKQFHCRILEYVKKTFDVIGEYIFQNLKFEYISMWPNIVPFHNYEEEKLFKLLKSEHAKEDYQMIKIIIEYCEKYKKISVKDSDLSTEDYAIMKLYSKCNAFLPFRIAVFSEDRKGDYLFFNVSNHLYCPFDVIVTYIDEQFAYTPGKGDEFRNAIREKNIEQLLKFNLPWIFFIDEQDQTEDMCLRYIQQANRYREIGKINLLKFCRIHTPRVCIAALKIYGEGLKYIQKKDINLPICLAAIRNNISSLEYIQDPSLYLCERAIDINPEAILYIKNPSEELVLRSIFKQIQDSNSRYFLPNQTPFETFKKIINRHSNFIEARNFRQLCSHLNNSEKEELYIIAVKKNGYLIKHCEFLTNNILLNAVKSNSDVFKNYNTNSQDIIKCAVKNNGLLLEYVKNPSDEICLMAIQQNFRALEYVPIQKEEFCIEAIKRSPKAIELIFNPSENVLRELGNLNPDIFRKITSKIHS